MDNSFDICAQIADLCADLTAMQSEASEVNEAAINKAADIILNEQKRVFARANFLRDKEKHVYKGADNSLISKQIKRIGKAKLKAFVGFDTDTLREYPELILVEFGRPGKSPRHSKATDKLGRKKGSFSESATVMPIRAGFNLARESALSAYAEDMFNKAEELWRGR